MKLEPKVLACAVLLAFAGPAQAQPRPEAQAQAAPAATYTVRKGDTLFGIARATRHRGVSQYQMVLGIWRANKDAFPGGNIHRMEVGMVLAMPSRETVAAIDAAQARGLVNELLEARTVPPAKPAVAAVKPAVPAIEPEKPGSKDAARRFGIAQSLERKGDHAGALAAYLESGEAGYGPAQVRLGQIYDSGSPATRRDYATSIKWYERARQQGMELPKQPQRTVPIN
jgi:pilus assembly protein FimV